MNCSGRTCRRGDGRPFGGTAFDSARDAREDGRSGVVGWHCRRRTGARDRNLKLARTDRPRVAEMPPSAPVGSRPERQVGSRFRDALTDVGSASDASRMRERSVLRTFDFVVKVESV